MKTDFVIGGWIRPGDFIREVNGDNFIRIDGINKETKEYKITIFWDWEKADWQEPDTYWESEEFYIDWDLYQPEDLIVSVFVEGVQ